MKKRRLLPIAGAYLATLSMGTMAADFIKFGQEEFDLTGGIFLQNFDTSANVKDDVSGIGGDVDLEDSLGFEDNDTTGYFDVTWRFSPKHRIGVSYFSSKRDVNARALEDIDLGQGDIIEAGASYQSDFNVQVIPVQYSYSFINDDRQEVYGTLGFHWQTIDYKVLAAAGVDEEVLEATINAKGNVPMPLIGGGWDYYINDRWMVSVVGQAFYIKISEDVTSFEGSIINSSLATEYYIWKNVGIGASLSYFKMDVDLSGGDWEGSLDYSYWGPAAYIKARF